MRNCVIVLLLLTGCSATYNGERLFSKATSLYEPISKNPKAATPEQFAAAIGAFERVTLQARGTAWAARAHVSIGSLYAIQQEYGKAREAYGLTLQNYNQYKELCLTARTAMAKTYESEANWDEAVKAYRDIVDFYPWTKTGLESPLYIGAMYVKRQQPEQAKKAFESAVGHYSKLLPNAPNPEMGLEVKGYLALAYQQLGEWDHAIAVLEELAGVPNGVNRPLVLLSLGSIYQAKLGDTQKAQTAYSALVTEFPDHPLGKVAKTRLEHLAVSITPR